MTVVTTTQTSAPKHSVDVSIDGVGVDYSSIAKVEVSLRENEHDLVTLVLMGISPLAITDYVDRPIKVTVKVPYGEGFTFCGYVNHVNPTHKVSSGKANRSLFQEAHLYCLGASSRMRGKTNRVWNDFKVKGMVEEFSRIYNFSYSCPDSSPVLPRMVQRNMSDWEALTRACAQSGLAVNVHGTEIHVWDPVHPIRYGAPSANLTTIETKEKSSTMPGRIMEFDGTFGTSHAYGSASAESIAILDDNGMLLKAKTENLMGSSKYGEALETEITNALPMEARSLEDAQRRLRATRAYEDAFVATTTTSGVAGVMPGSAVNIEGFNGDFDGLWLVRSMDMKFNRGHFITEFGLGRSNTGKVYYGQSSLDAYEIAPNPRLDNGKWRTTLRRGHVYSTN
jgi:phage protein D